MNHVEVRHAHLVTFSLVQLGVVIVGAILVLALTVAVISWFRARRSR